MKFSVIIPTYNRSSFVFNAIQSVVEQTYMKDFEIIIVDDCSTDDTELRINQLSIPKLRYYKLDKNSGNATARNKGVEVALGEYIVFLDSDDLMKKDCLKIFDRLLLEYPDTEFAFGKHEVYNVKTKKVNISNWNPNPEKSFLRELKIGTGCGIMINKACFDLVGKFDENLRVAVDTDWLIRLNKKVNYRFVPEVLVRVFLHEGKRVRNDKTELIKSYEIILNKNKNEIFKDAFLIKKFLYKLQWLNYHNGKIKDGNRFFFILVKHKVVLFKSIIIFVIFNLFNSNYAKKLHLKLSGENSI